MRRNSEELYLRDVLEIIRRTELADCAIVTVFLIEAEHSWQPFATYQVTRTSPAHPWQGYAWGTADYYRTKAEALQKHKQLAAVARRRLQKTERMRKTV